MYSSELEQRAQSVSNMLSAAGETRPWSTASSQWPPDLTQGWDRWAEREVKRWEPEKGSVAIAGSSPLKSKRTIFFSTLVGKKNGGWTHCPPTCGQLTAAHKRGGKKLDFTAS